MKPNPNKMPPARRNKDRIILIMTGFSCNNNCVFCSIAADKKDRTSKEIIKDLKKAYGRGYRKVEFLGGEAAIRKDFFKLLDCAKRMSFKVIQVTSNGRLFSYPEFAKKASRTGLTTVNVSLYAHKKELHDAVTRTPGSFEQCLAGIKNIAKVKDLALVINTVITRLNYKHIQKIGSLARSLGATEWHVIELLPEGRGVAHYGKLSIDYGKLAPYLAKVRCLLGQFRMIRVFDFPLCLFEYDLAQRKSAEQGIDFITPMKRFEGIEQWGYDNSNPVEKLKLKQRTIYQTSNRTKSSFCRKCREFDYCGGLTRAYFLKYGDREIRELARKHGFLG